MEAIGQNLRRLRGARGLTQGKLAEAAGLSRPGYRAIENGESVPRVDTLQAVADALDLGIEDLVRPPDIRFRRACDSAKRFPDGMPRHGTIRTGEALAYPRNPA